MSKLLPIVFVVVGLGGGVGAGFALKPPPPEMEECAEDDVECMEMQEAAKKPKKMAEHDTPSAFANLKKQFVIPIMSDKQVTALVVASLALEVDEGTEEQAYSLEPKLRDAFLQVLFVHARSGGFDGDFTSQVALRDLKERLLEVAYPIIGDTLRDVLLTEIVRQDL